MLGELKMIKLDEIKIMLDRLGLINRKVEFGIKFFIDGYECYVECKNDHYLFIFDFTGLELVFTGLDEFKTIIDNYKKVIYSYNTLDDIQFNEYLEDDDYKVHLETLLNHIMFKMRTVSTMSELNEYYKTNKLFYKNKEILDLNEKEYRKNHKRITINKIENDMFGVY